MLSLLFVINILCNLFIVYRSIYTMKYTGGVTFLSLFSDSLNIQYILELLENIGS